MKRHPTLIPISREHHQLLLLAQLLKKDAPPYRGLPDDRKGKIVYAESQYHQLICTHLRRDRQKLYPFFRKWPSVHSMLEDLETQAATLSFAFEKLDASTAEGELDTLGHALEKYVRHKERQLFQAVQQLMEEKDMQELQEHLQ